MPHTRFTNEEIVHRGQELYANSVRALVEKEENLGKIVVMDVETGAYEIDTDALTASGRALAKHPGAAIFAVRIGHGSVYCFNGI